MLEEAIADEFGRRATWFELPLVMKRQHRCRLEASLCLGTEAAGNSRSVIGWHQV
jgi:hypothetical protein